ncbi:hypothetical protein GCM10028771_33910 [Nocardioides marmoraquaticus]
MVTVWPDSGLVPVVPCTSPTGVTSASHAAGWSAATAGDTVTARVDTVSKEAPRRADARVRTSAP